MLLPISTIVPTRNRPEAFGRTLKSLAQQSAQPIEMIVVDGSDDHKTKLLCEKKIHNLKTTIRYYRATTLGAAIQRNQAFQHVSQPYTLFADDDIFFEPDCVMKLWRTLENDTALGGVCTLITNCHYKPPGQVSQLLFRFLHGQREKTYAGRCIGPALNLLPEDGDNLPELLPVEWMNTTCTLYRTEALPQPPFPPIFVGYSLMEDVTLSLTVAKHWPLANVRTAKIFHDSQPGDHKNNPAVLAKMGLVNRHFVMTQILERRQLNDYFKLSVLQLFEIAASLTSCRGWVELPAVVGGKLSAIGEIILAEPASRPSTNRSTTC